MQRDGPRDAIVGVHFGHIEPVEAYIILMERALCIDSFLLALLLGAYTKVERYPL